MGSKTSEELARSILWRFFSLQRVALGHSGGGCGDLERGGWTLRHHMELVRVLGDGCHNLPEIASGRWWDTRNRHCATEDVLRESLNWECRWLYDRADNGLSYPAAWDRDAIISAAWHGFWEAVAEPLDLPARFGEAWEEIETQEAAYRRLRQEAEYRDLVHLPPWWARVFLGWRGTILPSDFSKTRFIQTGGTKR